MSGRRRHGSMLDLWVATAEAQWATWMTLSARMPMLMAGTMTAREQSRMVSEKVEAAAESLRNTAIAVGTMGLASPNAIRNGSAAANILQAASSPYHRRVKANAKRLHRKKS